MKIFFVRHGIVENPEGKVHGRSPGFHLSQKGREQIEETAAQIKNEEVGNIYTSPLERTAETADIIASTLNIPKDHIVVDQRLIEVEFFQGEGTPIKEFFGLPNCRQFQEKAESIIARMTEAFEDEIKTGRSFVVVSHGDPLTYLLYFLNEKFEIGYPEKYVRKGEIIELDYIENKLKYTRTISPSYQENRH